MKIYTGTQSLSSSWVSSSWCYITCTKVH